MIAAPPLKIALRLALVLALATTALVGLTPGRAAAAGVPCQKTYSNTVDVPIPDQSSIDSVIDVDEDGLTVSDLDVSFNIDHTFDGDLEISLLSETDADTFRSYTRLVMRDGINQDNFVGTVLDDEASTPISWGAAPFTGRFLPNQRLSETDGEVDGRYQLDVVDWGPGDVGTLKDWSITVRYQSCDFDSDGVEDHGDKCLSLAAATVTGCPATTRTVTAKYKIGKFRGALSSPVAGCKAGRSVTIWKLRSGADRKVGTATTASDGRYKLTRAKRAGKYYATSPRVAVTDVAECPAVTSSPFRIR